MEQSWLQKQTALNKFDGFRDSEPLSCVKPTAARAAPMIHKSTEKIPEAGGVADVVYDPQDATADWSGFVPRHAPGRRRAQQEPAAHRETIVRSEEHGIVPAPHADTRDSVRTRRRRCSQPGAREGVVLGEPIEVDSTERFATRARAADAGEPTAAELRSEDWRYQRMAGKKRITAAYDKSNRSRPETRVVVKENLRAPSLGERRRSASNNAEDAQNVPDTVLGFRARVPNGPGSFLSGLGKEVAESGDVVRETGGRRSKIRQKSRVDGSNSTTSMSSRNKDLFLENYNPYVAGYTGHQPRRL